MRHLITVAIGLLFFVASSLVCAQDTERILTVEFDDVGQVCLDDNGLKEVTERLRKAVLPQGAAITIVAYSDQTEATRRRPGLTSPCISHLVPRGISSHQRIALFRALQVVEIAQELDLQTFDGTPLLVVGAENFRQRDPAGIAVLARRAQGTRPVDRRVEVWVSRGTPSGTAAPLSASAGGGTVVMTPIVLPPAAYAGGGSGGAVYVQGGASSSQALVGWTFMGLGLAAIVGGVFSLLEANKAEDREQSFVFNPDLATAARDDANSFNQIGGWALGIGAGLSALGLVFVLTSPDTPDQQVSLSVGPAPSDLASSLMLKLDVTSASW